MAHSLPHTPRPAARPIHTAVRSALIALLAVTAAHGTMAAAQSSTAASSAQQQYDIAPGALDENLARFAARAGISITIPPHLVAGKHSNGLQGRYAIDDGLNSLLAGSGLTARGNGTSYVIIALSSNEVQLAPVMVTADSARPGLTEGSGSFTTDSTSAATGMQLSLRETPQSVTVMTRERMDQQGLGSLADVATHVPGVFQAGSGTPIGGRTELFARGFQIDNYLIDGMNVPWEVMGESERYGQSALDTSIYDSITVVRGATGLLTGAGDPSASVLLVRKKPTRAFQGSVSGSVGSWDRRRGVVDIGGPLTEHGNVRGRLVGAYEEGKTWVDDYSNDRTMLYGVLEVDLSDRSLLTLALEHARDSSEGAPWAGAYGIPLFFSDGQTRTHASRRTSAAPHWAFSDTERTTATASLEHQFNADWNARVTYLYSKFQSDMRRGMVMTLPISGAPGTVRILDLEMQNETHAFDAQVEGKYTLWGRKHDVVAGINLTETDQDYTRSRFGNLPGAAQWNGSQLIYTNPNWAALPDTPTTATVTQYGAYAATRLRATDRLSVLLGGRLSYWKSQASNVLPPYTVTDDRRYRDEFTPYAGVVFDLTQSLSAYASYTGIFNPQTFRDVQGRLLDPVEGKNYEVGLKGEWFDGRLNASAAVFESHRDNLAVRDGNNLTPDGQFAYRAESQTKGRGWELEVAGQLTPNWQIQGGYSRFVIRDDDGLRLNPDRPAHQFKLYTSYQPVMLSRLTVGGGVTWQSKTYGPGSVGAQRKAYTIDSHAVFNLSARYELNDQLSLSANLNNVFDKSYRTSYYDHSYGAPRNLMATLKYQF